MKSRNEHRIPNLADYKQILDKRQQIKLETINNRRNKYLNIKLNLFETTP